MRVLIADDDRVNRQILSKFLEKWGYETVVATDGDEAWQILQQEDAPRLALLDRMMPGMDGAQICREIRKRREPFYTYLLLVTAKFQKQDILEGLEAGADDYLTKPYDHSELRARLRTGRRILELQEELLRAHDRLQHEASHDSLTGAWNRGAILEILQADLARSQRSGTSVGIVLLDLDHFKQVNDTFGHLAGDVVLQEVSRRMKSCVRAYDAVGRWGGEEFLIVIPESDRNTVQREAERVRRVIEERPVETPEGNIPITISAGICVRRGASPGHLSSLLRDADLALYQAKERGRNRVEAAPETEAELSASLPPDRSFFPTTQATKETQTGSTRAAIGTSTGQENQR